MTLSNSGDFKPLLGELLISAVGRNYDMFIGDIRVRLVLQRYENDQYASEVPPADYPKVLIEAMAQIFGQNKKVVCKLYSVHESGSLPWLTVDPRQETRWNMEDDSNQIHALFTNGELKSVRFSAKRALPKPYTTPGPEPTVSMKLGDWLIKDLRMQPDFFLDGKLMRLRVRTVRSQVEVEGRQWDYSDLMAKAMVRPDLAECDFESVEKVNGATERWCFDPQQVVAFKSEDGIQITVRQHNTTVSKTMTLTRAPFKRSSAPNLGPIEAKNSYSYTAPLNVIIAAATVILIDDHAATPVADGSGRLLLVLKEQLNELYVGAVEFDPNIMAIVAEGTAIVNDLKHNPRRLEFYSLAPLSLQRVTAISQALGKAVSG